MKNSLWSNDWLKNISTFANQSQLNSFRGCEVVLSFVFRRNKFFAFFLLLSTQIEKFVYIEKKWLKGNGGGKFKTNITADNYSFVLHNISEDRISFLSYVLLSNFCLMLFCSINQFYAHSYIRNNDWNRTIFSFITCDSIKSNLRINLLEKLICHKSQNENEI